MKKIILLIITVIGSFLFAETSDFYIKNSNKEISKINIKGLKKTRKSIVSDILHVREGDLLSLFNEDSFSQEILKTGILQEPVITYILEEDKVILDINLKDKWTIIPAPIVSVSKDNQTYGALFYESNFLGLHKSLFTSASYSTKNGINGNINYSEPNLIPGLLSGNIGGAILSNKEVKYLNFNGEDMGEYSLFNFNFFTALFVDINKYNRVGVRAVFNHYDIDNKSAEVFKESGNSQFLESTIYYGLDKQRYTSTICTGFINNSSFKVGLNLSSLDTYLDINSTIKYTYRLKNDLHLRVGGSISMFDKPYLSEQIWGGMNYSRTVAALSHDRHLASGFEMEYPVLNFSWATFTLLALFEGGLYNRDNSNWVNYYGPGAGLRMYFPWMSVPAMGLDYGYNIENGTHNISFVMGI